MAGLKVTPFSPMAALIVRKAPVAISHPAKQKALSNSQQTLFTMLEKRLKRYVAGQQSRSQASGATRDPRGHISISSFKAPAVYLSGTSYGRETNARISPTCNTRQRNVESIKHRGSSHFSSEDTVSTSTDTLINKMECAELAEHVVKRARNRLKRRSKQTLNQLPSFCNPTSLNAPHCSRNNLEGDKTTTNCSNRTKISQETFKTSFNSLCSADRERANGQRSPSKNRPASVFTSSLTEKANGQRSPSKNIPASVFTSSLTEKANGQRSPSKNKPASIFTSSLTEKANGQRSPSKNKPASIFTSSLTEKANGQRSPSKNKPASVFTSSLTVGQGQDASRVQSHLRTLSLSEKQSTKPKDTATSHVPTHAHAHSGHARYTPSRGDGKSQRESKDRLYITLSPEKDDLSKKDVEDRRKKLEAVTRLKAKQRAEIYALNAAMRDFEEKKFEQFISGNV